MEVFVAVAGPDRPRIQRVFDELHRDDVGPWRPLEVLERGAGWQQEAASKIAASDALLFVVSPLSTLSPHCRWELDLAERLGKPRFQWCLTPVLDEHPALLLPVVSTAGLESVALWDFCQPPTRTSPA